MLTNRIIIKKASSFIVCSLSFVYKKKKEEIKEERRNMLLSNNLKYGGVTPPHGSFQYTLINTVINKNTSHKCNLHISDYLHIIEAGDCSSEQLEKCTICGSSLTGFLAGLCNHSKMWVKTHGN